MTSKRTPENVTIRPRNLHFHLDSADNPHWLNGDPVATAVLNTLSLTFPDGERLFMDAVRAHSTQVNGKLAQDVKDFIAQEAIHSREHHMLNQLIDRNKYPVEKIEARVRENIALSRDSGPKRMLMATICLEHFTAMLADMMVTHDDLFSKTDPEIERLWRWHAMEETEHKAVAYDVFLDATKDWSGLKRYVRRSLAMLIISRQFTNNITEYAAWMLEAEGYEPRDARKRVKRFLWKEPGFFRRGGSIWASWFKPGFHPWDHDNRALMDEWRSEFDLSTGYSPSS